MATRNPAYIVKNHNGIWYFRYTMTASGKEFRRTLKTRCRRTAIKRARIWWVKMIEDSEDFQWMKDIKLGKELLDELENFNEYEEKTFDYLSRNDFFAHLTPHQFHCLKLAADHANSKNQPSAITDTESPKKSLQSILNEYIESIRLRTTNQQTLNAYKSHCQLFLKIIDTAFIDAEAVRKYKNIFPRLPKNIATAKHLKGKSLQEILNMSHSEVRAAATIKTIFTYVSSFLKWQYKNHYLQEDYSEMFKGAVKIKKRASENTAAFTNEDLTKLFSIPEYQHTGFRKYPWRYWMPLLGLYTGCRANELAQLHLEDVYKIGNILVLDINDKPGRKVKTQASKRIIPVHKQLLKLGFESYIAEITRRKETRLFPHLKPNSNNSYISKMTRFFNAAYKTADGLLDYAGIEKQSDLGKKNFHSFRHTFLNRGKQALIDALVLKELAGHERKDITFDRYGKDFSLPLKQKELNKIKFDVQHPIKWERRFY